MLFSRYLLAVGAASFLAVLPVVSVCCDLNLTILENASLVFVLCAEYMEAFGYFSLCSRVLCVPVLWKLVWKHKMLSIGCSFCEILENNLFSSPTWVEMQKE